MTTIGSLPQTSTAAPPLAAGTVVESLRRGARADHRRVLLDSNLRARSLPFAELVEAGEDLSHVLIGQFGVERGDRVGLLVEPAPDDVGLRQFLGFQVTLRAVAVVWCATRTG